MENANIYFNSYFRSCGVIFGKGHHTKTEVFAPFPMASNERNEWYNLTKRGG